MRLHGASTGLGPARAAVSPRASPRVVTPRVAQAQETRRALHFYHVEDGVGVARTQAETLVFLFVDLRGGLAAI